MFSPIAGHDTTLGYIKIGHEHKVGWAWVGYLDIRSISNLNLNILFRF